MLPKTHKLNRAQVKKVLRSGKRLNQTGYTFIYLPSDKTRISVVVPISLSPLSTLRNHLRRQVYLGLSDLVSQFPNIDSVIMVRSKSPIDLSQILKILPK